jgi:hypothetical protein
MNALLLQIILARRNDDVESYMNILFIVVLAIFWLVGGIIKAKANKSRTGSKENQPRKPARKPPVHSQEAREQMLKRLERPSDAAKAQRKQPKPATQKPRMKFADLQAAVRKFAVEAEKAFEADKKDTEAKAPPVKPKPVLFEPQKKAETIKLIEPIDGTAKGIYEKESPEAAQTYEPEYLYELLTDYSDPDQLRRAILHYEILGKPLSLREPSERSLEL